MNGPLVCERCGMVYYEWMHASITAMANDEPMIPNLHECPEPYPRDVAESLAIFHASTGIPVHPRTYAQIRLGLMA